MYMYIYVYICACVFEKGRGIESKHQGFQNDLKKRGRN